MEELLARAPRPIHQFLPGRFWTPHHALQAGSGWGGPVVTVCRGWMGFQPKSCRMLQIYIVLLLYDRVKHFWAHFVSLDHLKLH